MIIIQSKIKDSIIKVFTFIFYFFESLDFRFLGLFSNPMKRDDKICKN